MTTLSIFLVTFRNMTFSFLSSEQSDELNMWLSVENKRQRKQFSIDFFSRFSDFTAIFVAIPLATSNDVPFQTQHECSRRSTVPDPARVLTTKYRSRPSTSAHDEVPFQTQPECSRRSIVPDPARVLTTKYRSRPSPGAHDEVPFPSPTYMYSSFLEGLRSKKKERKETNKGWAVIRIMNVLCLQATMSLHPKHVRP